MVKYRVRFAKRDGAEFLSHLDLVQIFSRAARRCGLPLAYSHGFNPHAELVFSAPLPLGVTSEAEFVDMTVEEEQEPAALVDRLRRALPHGVYPLEAVALPDGSSTVMKHVYACVYRLCIQVRGISAGDYMEQLQALLAGSTPIPVMKKTKSGVRETDIRPMLYTCTREDVPADVHTDVPADVPAGVPADGSAQRLYCTVVTAAGNEMNLRPEIAVQGLTEQIRKNRELDAEVLSVHKVRYLTQEGHAIL